MNEIQVWTFDKLAENYDIRTYEADGNPWFCLSDVCKVLDIKNASDAKRSLSGAGIALTDTLTKGGNQQITFINEANLYRLIMRSRKKDAVVFSDWVCEEVLPAIRKTGGYLTADAQIAIQTMVKEEIDRKLGEVNHKLALLAGSRTHHTVSDYLRYKGLPVRDVAEWSRMCKAYSKQNGYKVEKVNGQRYPTNAYHQEVLEYVIFPGPSRGQPSLFDY